MGVGGLRMGEAGFRVEEWGWHLTTVLGSQLMSCVKEEVAVLGYPSLIARSLWTESYTELCALSRFSTER